MAVVSVHVPKVSSSCLLTLPNQKVGLTQASSNACSILGPRARETLCEPVSAEYFPPPAGSPEMKPPRLSKPDVWGLVFLVQDLRAVELDGGLEPPAPEGGSAVVIVSPLVVLLQPSARRGGLGYTLSLPLLPISLWFLL